jgi:hypothetical protein
MFGWGLGFDVVEDRGEVVTVWRLSVVLIMGKVVVGVFGLALEVASLVLEARLAR